MSGVYTLDVVKNSRPSRTLAPESTVCSLTHKENYLIIRLSTAGNLKYTSSSEYRNLCNSEIR